MMANENRSQTPAASRGGRRIRNDVIFITALLLAVCLLGACYLLLRREGDVVEVTVDGEIFGVYSLGEDRRVEIVVGDCRNVLIIQNGEAYVTDASCPDGICEAHRPISKSGESIVCLPNRVVVTVQKTEEKPAPDVVG
jgi:hypothetical protein